MNKESHKNIAFALVCLCFSMIFLSFASAPIYDLFCKATGFGGTTQEQKAGESFSHNKIGKRKVIVEFDANVTTELPWRFVPKQRRVEILTGQNALIFYESENISKDDIIGTSVYNVSPAKAGKYFVKIHCFCFEEQLLKAGEKLLMPVSFFIDPAFDDDEEMADVSVITLSYSFFKVR